MSAKPKTYMKSIVRPLVKLTPENRDAYERLMRDNSHAWAIPEDYSFEEILSHMIRQEMAGGRESRRQELITVLGMMDLSDIPE